MKNVIQVTFEDELKQGNQQIQAQFTALNCSDKANQK